MQTQPNAAFTLPTQSEAEEIAAQVHDGVISSDRVDSTIWLMLKDEAYGQVSIDQVGILTVLADELTTAAGELRHRADRIREAAVDLHR